MRVPGAARRPHEPRLVEPRTAAERPKAAAFLTSTSIFFTIVSILVLRACPLPDVAQHIEQTKRVRFKATHWCGLCVTVGAVVMSP
jgi:hypothetical protein